MEFLSKKGKLNDVFEDFKKVNPEEKKILGQLVNHLKTELEEKFSQFNQELNSEKKGKDNSIDFSLPGDLMTLGSRHPLSIVQNQIVSIPNTMPPTIAITNPIDNLHILVAIP